jgi:hypothetical protein
MHTDTTRSDVRLLPTAHGFDTTHDGGPDQTLAYERAVDAMVADGCLAVGQGIGLRASLAFDAVAFLHAHFRPKFLAAMHHFGNRWLEDRHTVTAVAMMLGERAVRYADGAPTIGLDAIRRASADVERYCQLHAARRTRGHDRDTTEGATARIAGYWCTWDPKP